MSKLVPISKDFQSKLIEFIKNLQSCNENNVSYEMGTKWVKIFIGDFSTRIVYCFIDFSGNMYKANSDVNPGKKIGSIYE